MTPNVTRHPAAPPPPHGVIGQSRENGIVRANGLLPGDIILVHSHGRLAPRLIGFGQRRHHPPEFAYWTHAAIYVGKVETHVLWPDSAERSPSGHDALIEAKGGSPVRYVPLSQYDVRDYAAIRFSVMPEQPNRQADYVMRANAVRFLEEQLGKRYEYLADVNLGLWSLLGGTRLLLGGVNSWFCSDLASAQAMYLGVIWPWSPLGIMPADIAQHFGIRR